MSTIEQQTGFQSNTDAILAEQVSRGDDIVQFGATREALFTPDEAGQTLAGLILSTEGTMHPLEEGTKDAKRLEIGHAHPNVTFLQVAPSKFEVTIAPSADKKREIAKDATGVVVPQEHASFMVKKGALPVPERSKIEQDRYNLL